MYHHCSHCHFVINVIIVISAVAHLQSSFQSSSSSFSSSSSRTTTTAIRFIMISLFQEKRKVYENQHHLMEEKGMSFLDSVRNESQD
jgi:hypothetical protein